MSDITANVTLKDNSDEVGFRFRQADRRGLDAIGFTAENYAKTSIQNADRIDTDRLLHSSFAGILTNTLVAPDNVGRLFIY